MGPLSPVCAYSLWAGLCPEKLVKLRSPDIAEVWPRLKKYWKSSEFNTEKKVIIEALLHNIYSKKELMTRNLRQLNIFPTWLWLNVQSWSTTSLLWQECFLYFFFLVYQLLSNIFGNIIFKCFSFFLFLHFLFTSSRALTCAKYAPTEHHGQVNLPIPGNLVITWPYTNCLWPSVHTTGIPL